MNVVAPVPLRLTPSPVPVLVTAPRRRVRFALLGHSPALDGLRGLAVLVVLVFHFVGHHFLRGGTAGVDIFFCLSGFLITALILDERRVHGRLSVGRFYARRACRLLPALFLLLGAWVLVMAFFHDQTWMGATPSGDGTGRTIEPGESLRDIGVALLYLANWNVIGGEELPLPHLWSLAVEEQFYLIWPTLLLGLLLLGRRTRLIALGLLIVGSAALPWVYWDGGVGQNRIYFGTDTRAVGLLAGAFAALVWHERRALERRTRLARVRAGSALALLLVAIATKGPDEAKFLVYPALLALTVSQLVPYLAENRGRLARAFRMRWLTWMGRRSYALYLWQYPWATWTHPYGPWGIVAGVVATFVTAELSWRLLEAPVQRFGRRFAVSTAPSASTAPPRLARRVAA